MPPMVRTMRSEEIEKRIVRLHQHVEKHPADYEAVIAELKLKSELIDRVRREGAVERLKEISAIRKRRKDAEQGQ